MAGAACWDALLAEGPESLPPRRTVGRNAVASDGTQRLLGGAEKLGTLQGPVSSSRAGSRWGRLPPGAERRCGGPRSGGAPLRAPRGPRHPGGASLARQAPRKRTTKRTTQLGLNRPATKILLRWRAIVWSGRQDLNLRPLGPERRVKPAHPLHPAAQGRNPLIPLHLRRSKNRTGLPIVRLGCRRGLRADCGTRATPAWAGLRAQPRKPRSTTFPQSSSRFSSRPAPSGRPRRRGRAPARNGSRRSSGELRSRQRRSLGHQIGEDR